jgi:universal stress protein E
MRRFLCATDLFSKSEAAIDRAGLLAQERQASLSLLHVVAPMEPERVLEQTLQNAIAQMKSRAQPPSWRNGPSPAVLIRAGNPARLILDAARELKSDLLILGPHRSRGIRDVFEGTIAEKALTARKLPLLIVREAPRAAYRNVLLALDLSAVSGFAVEAAESLVLSSRARARIVHAYEPPYQDVLLPYGVTGARPAAPYADIGWKRAANVAIRNLLKYRSADFTRYDVLVEDGEPASLIVQAIEAYEPDLLVMGTRGRGRLQRALLGSVANQVLNRARCDVLVVPERAAAAGRKASANRALTTRVSRFG